MTNSFKEHRFSDGQKLWLQESAKTDFDARVAKVKLQGKIPIDFDQRDIDRRLYSEGRITAIGLWHVDHEHPFLTQVHKVISAIRDQIIKKPGIEHITAQEIASITNMTVDEVTNVFDKFNFFGSFYSGYSKTNDAVTGISLTGEFAYDEYLKYSGIDNLLERLYVTRAERSLAETLNFVTPELEDIHQIVIKRNTAFVLMPLNPSNPELTDVKNTIKRVCKEFEINAYTANEIEHQDRITDLILREIACCEFLIADLSLERPNVYYEIGYAHALNKKPILYRRAGTKLHFDLSVHNVPEYKNITELEEMLRKRLEAILGRGATS